MSLKLMDTNLASFQLFSPVSVIYLQQGNNWLPCVFGFNAKSLLVYKAPCGVFLHTLQLGLHSELLTETHPWPYFDGLSCRTLACLGGISKSILLVKWHIILAQCGVHSVKRWYLNFDLVIGVFWAEYELNQWRDKCLPFPFKSQVLNSGTHLWWGKGMWSSAAGPLPHHFTIVPSTTLFDCRWKKKLVLIWAGWGALQRPSVCANSQSVDQTGQDGKYDPNQ